MESIVEHNDMLYILVNFICRPTVWSTVNVHGVNIRKLLLSGQHCRFIKKSFVLITRPKACNPDFFRGNLQSLQKDAAVSGTSNSSKTGPSYATSNLLLTNRLFMYLYYVFCMFN